MARVMRCVRVCVCRVCQGHKLFSPPYDRRVTVGLLMFCMLGGAGAIGSAVCYQQAKGGFWFKKKAQQMK